jgi:GTP1/Obg family GTP-binding protein
MDKFHQELFDVLTKSRNVRQSKAAAMQQPEMITICKKEYEDLKDNKCANVIKQVVRKSMAASAAASGINQAQVIHNFLFNKH